MNIFSYRNLTTNEIVPAHYLGRSSEGRHLYKGEEGFEPVEPYETNEEGDWMPAVKIKVGPWTEGRDKGGFYVGRKGPTGEVLVRVFKHDENDPRFGGLWGLEVVRPGAHGAREVITAPSTPRSKQHAKDVADSIAAEDYELS